MTTKAFKKRLEVSSFFTVLGLFGPFEELHKKIKLHIKNKGLWGLIIRNNF